MTPLDVWLGDDRMQMHTARVGVGVSWGRLGVEVKIRVQRGHAWRWDSWTGIGNFTPTVEWERTA